jgi:hypothetical protein
MLNIVSITQCTNRKRSNGTRILANEISASNPIDFLRQWKKLIKTADAKIPVEDLYCGRGFSEFLGGANALTNSERYAISAGLGLVKFGYRIPSYDLTVSTKSKVPTAIKSLQKHEWWTELNKHMNGNPVPLSSLVAEESVDAVLLCISKSYLPLIATDFETISQFLLDKVRLIGPIGRTGLSDKMQKVLMPYNHNLDGPDSPIQGTKADFAQRAFRHFVEHIFLNNPGASYSEHRASVNDAMISLAPAKMIFDREKLSDQKIVERIMEYWGTCNGKSSLVLRHLRDQGYACEQSRFARLFREVKKSKAQHA